MMQVGSSNRHSVGDRAIRLAGKRARAPCRLGDLKNFFDAARSRGKCSCDPETAHRSTATTLLGRIALQVGEQLDWDGAAERFTNSEKANALLSYEYRKPWSLEA